MNIVQRAELEDLAAVQDGQCVTVYQPVHPAYPETQADPILFRNLLDRAEQALLDQGVRTPDARELLKPARELQADGSFWRSNGACGLAMFAARGFFRQRRLPYGVAESADVGTGFYLTPLARSLVEDTRFLLLALSPKRVQLFRGDSFGMSAVDLPENVPSSESELSESVETEYASSQQQHTSAGFGKGGLRGTMHGQGDPREGRKTVYEDFLYLVARELEPLLKEENLPLFVAAVEATHPIFQRACQYPLLQREGVTGSPRDLGEKTMFEQALPLAKAWSQRHQDETRKHYDRFRNTDRAGDDLATLVAAAAQGRISALFAAVGERRWGTFDPASQRAVEHFENQPGDVDLVDLAVKQSLTHGSEVFVVPAGKVPDDKPAVATFRW